MNVIGIDVGGTNTIMETESGTPVTTELIRPGLRVSVLGLTSSPLYRTEEALRVVGPKAFGYDIPFTPLHRSS